MMSRKKGQTQDRYKAIVADCMKRISRDNISHKEWCEYASETYDITIRRCEMLWTESWASIKEKFQKDAETNLMQAVARLDDLYSIAVKESSDFNTKNNILREKHRLLGLYVDKQEVKNDIKLSFDFETEED